MKVRIRANSDGCYVVEYKKGFFSTWNIECVTTSLDCAHSRVEIFKKNYKENEQIRKLGIIREENLNEE